MQNTGGLVACCPVNLPVNCRDVAWCLVGAGRTMDPPNRAGEAEGGTMRRISRLWVVLAVAITGVLLSPAAAFADGIVSHG
jgi:hypothetical protein